MQRIATASPTQDGTGSPPIGWKSYIKFRLQNKNEMYLNFESVIYRKPGTRYYFVYPCGPPVGRGIRAADDRLVREYKATANIFGSTTRTVREPWMTLPIQPH